MKKKVIFLLKHWEDIIAATALTTMTFAAVMNVITRYVFNQASLYLGRGAAVHLPDLGGIPFCSGGI